MPDSSGDKLPLTEATFCILLSLVPGPKHGYAIMKDVQALSDQRVTLSTGTLYGALKRLLDQGAISRVDTPAPDELRRVAKAYLLTGRGRRMLEAETARLETLVRTAHARAVRGRART